MLSLFSRGQVKLLGLNRRQPSSASQALDVARKQAIAEPNAKIVLKFMQKVELQ